MDGARFDMSLPENQRKLEAVQQLAKVADDAGVSMIELAIAFVVNHPAVTSTIIGPRTMEQLESQLPAADVVLDPATLDRIEPVADSRGSSWRIQRAAVRTSHGISAASTVPPPAGLTTRSRPPTVATRSWSSRSPEPRAGPAPPIPSSETR